MNTIETYLFLSYSIITLLFHMEIWKPESSYLSYNYDLIYEKGSYTYVQL